MREGFDPQNLEPSQSAVEDEEGQKVAEDLNDSREWSDGSKGKDSGPRRTSYASLGDGNVWDSQND